MSENNTKKKMSSAKHGRNLYDSIFVLLLVVCRH